MVNGSVVNVPSYEVKTGDVVSVREKSKSLEVIQNAITSKRNTYSWLEWDSNLLSGKLLTLPSREDIPENIKEQLIVELYSK
jgi:small subunit ribosomal protein S4